MLSSSLPAVAPCLQRTSDRKSTRLNFSHSSISYAVFCLKKKIGLTLVHTRRSYGAFPWAITSLPSIRFFPLRLFDTISSSFFRPEILSFSVFFFNDTATTEIYTLSLHDALPISGQSRRARDHSPHRSGRAHPAPQDRKSTRLNSSHSSISYAVFCLKKKKNS